jgi:hypothetical protein
MTGQNLDFSEKIKNLFSSKGAPKGSFIDNIILALHSKLNDHNEKNPGSKVSLAQIKEVYKRGVNDAIKLEKPMGLWAMARLNLFLKYAKGSSVPYEYEKLDRDLLNPSSFHIDNEVGEDIIFSYEQISESRFEIESFGLDSEEDYSFVDLDEYSEANFPEVLEVEVEEEKELPKYKKKEDEDPEKIEKEEKKKADEENKELPELKDSDNKYYK